ncbi:Csu type fimbrial protein [Marinimicrobium alkaliphilum]|uniref:Csu type fimbrial protein n=1 Tax=Marinimicrobium alkaliphilum TaxID=2202654 RepID=UPI000DB91D7B|nr:spore coat U domain-containing protein [Marinimicrobium alkaliphilum]
MKKTLTQLAIATALITAPAWANAQVGAETDSDTIAVSAAVANSCIISTNPLDFGNVDVTVAANVDQTTLIEVTCTNDATYHIGLNAGINEDVGQRRMALDATNFLIYELYKDLGHTEVWGNDTGVETTLVAEIGTGSAQPHSVYGRIVTDTQNGLPAGSYTDTVTATVYY